ncbi:hypothetical protein [Pseudomonas sp. SR18]|uniref:hypothetical protein n=1 Tax=Pseudomonas sp. SR18 TaxID=1461074 RepID=UPI0020333928|nr:hypothetical protein [Pseudomonas sp. SR18]MCM2362860.1 hypothetical protein [Pseudomonas sp. SR18]
MSYEAPSMAGSTSSNNAEVRLASNQLLEFSIPEPNDIPASASVCLIVGPDPELPDFKSDFQPAGTFDEDQEDFVKTSNLKFSLSSNDLKGYSNKTVEIRYLIRSESGDWDSEPLTVKILS